MHIPQAEITLDTMYVAKNMIENALMLLLLHSKYSSDLVATGEYVSHCCNKRGEGMQSASTQVTYHVV